MLEKRLKVKILVLNNKMNVVNKALKINEFYNMKRKEGDNQNCK